MFAFRYYSGFGTFRDPLTITQNLSFLIPPKTAVGGILAAILGLDYNTYFSDPNYFDFKYSVVLKRLPRKKSFSQNYIVDYTKLSSTKLNSFLVYKKSLEKLKELEYIKEALLSKDEKDLTKKEDTTLKNIDSKIKKTQNDFIKKEKKVLEQTEKKFPSPKPIFRELLINPEYFIFVKNYKYEEEIIKYLKNHESSFPLYMGNTEFSANYEYINDCSFSEEKADLLHSFCSNPAFVSFEVGKKYVPLYAALKAQGKREYKDYQTLLLCDQSISLKEEKTLTLIKSKLGDFYCDFV